MLWLILEVLRLSKLRDLVFVASRYDVGVLLEGWWRCLDRGMKSQSTRFKKECVSALTKGKVVERKPRSHEGSALIQVKAAQWRTSQGEDVIMSGNVFFY